jgi:hypothetical protein
MMLGCAIITLDEAFLFTDGRYFLQAEKQLDRCLFLNDRIKDLVYQPTWTISLSSNWKLMKQGLAGGQWYRITGRPYACINSGSRCSYLAGFFVQGSPGMLRYSRPYAYPRQRFQLVLYLSPIFGRTSKRRLGLESIQLLFPLVRILHHNTFPKQSFCFYTQKYCH